MCVYVYFVALFIEINNELLSMDSDLMKGAKLANKFHKDAFMNSCIVVTKDVLTGRFATMH